MSPGDSTFSVVIINLDRDADRLAYVKRQLDGLGLPFERFAAVSGTDLPPNVRPFFSPSEDGSGFLSKGEIGCYGSHLSVYQRIVSGEIPAPALVLEDDVLLPANLKEIVAATLQKAPAGWDMIRLSSPAKRAFVAVAKVDDSHTLARYSISPGSNGAILISKSGARKFLKPVERSLPIDQDNKCVWAFDLNLYGVVPEPVHSNSLGTSSIDDLSSGRQREERLRQRLMRDKRRFGRRHAWNIREFGPLGWLASEIVSLIAPLVARRHRPAFLESAAWTLRAISRPPRPALAEEQSR